MSRFDTIGAPPSRATVRQGRQESRSGQAARRWPPAVALSAAAAVSAGLWMAVVAAVRALL